MPFRERRRLRAPPPTLSRRASEAELGGLRLAPPAPPAPLPLPGANASLRSNRSPSSPCRSAGEKRSYLL